MKQSASVEFTSTRPAAHALADHGPAAPLQRKLSDAIANSPFVVAQRQRLASMFGAAAQKKGPEEEEVTQGKFDSAQRKGPNEEEMTQGKFDSVQRKGAEEELLQGKFWSTTVQREEQKAESPNRTGLPDSLKAGVENLSGMSMDDVKVHYNSSKPSQLQALAYTQGSDIHVGPGQEQHLAHEAWHVVQQKQGRVQPTMQMRDTPVNDDTGLEKEADAMGGRALGVTSPLDGLLHSNTNNIKASEETIQRYSLGIGKTRNVTVSGKAKTKTFEECYYNFVEYKLGDPRGSNGTGTKSPAAWAGWLVNKKNGNNATQLHVVNQRWGGLGGSDDKNIVPGTPAENSHHLHEAEKKFDLACFGTTSPGPNATAIQDAKYECLVTPTYGQNVDVSTGSVDTGDPQINVNITAASNGGNFPVTPGTEGLTFKEGS